MNTVKQADIQKARNKIKKEITKLEVRKRISGISTPEENYLYECLSNELAALTPELGAVRVTMPQEPTPEIFDALHEELSGDPDGYDFLSGEWYRRVYAAIMSAAQLQAAPDGVDNAKPLFPEGFDFGKSIIGENLRDAGYELVRKPPMAGDEIKPCPFCPDGGEPEKGIGKHGDGSDWHYIECGKCGACAEPYVWQARTPPDVRKIEGLQEAIALCDKYRKREFEAFIEKYKVAPLNVVAEAARRYAMQGGGDDK